VIDVRLKMRVPKLPGCAGVAPAHDAAIHHGSEGILPAATPRERDAFAPWQPVNEHQCVAQRVLADGIDPARAG
jgi:hypothetical protein